MTFTSELPLVQDVPATFWLHCSYCGRPARSAETETGAVLNALFSGWKISRSFVATSENFIGVDDFKTADCFCPSCLKREFE